MTSETFNPSYCTVEEAEIESVDERKISIAPLIAGVNIRQSIYQAGIVGSIEILDSVGVLHNHPLRAEETITLVLKAHDLQTELTLKGQIIKINNVSKTDSGDAYIYTLHFVTKTTFEAGKRNIKTAYRNRLGSYAAKDIFKKYYNKNKELTQDTDKGTNSQVEEMPLGSNRYKITSDKGRRFYIEDSSGNMRTIIPDYSPAQAMRFLASKSLSNNQSPSNMYRFFETYDGYYWVTDEWLLKRAALNDNKVKDFYYLPFTEQDPRKGNLIVKTILGFKNSDHADTISDMTSGGYRNSVLEIDFTNHHRQYYDFDYSKQKFVGMKGAIKTSSAGAVHSDKFIKETFTSENAPQQIVFRDWQDDTLETKDGQVPREPQKFVEIIQNRMAYNHHIQNSRVQISLEGRLDLKPGDVLNVITQEPDVALSQEQNERLSGKYLVSTVAHDMKENRLDTICEILKYEWERGDV